MTLTASTTRLPRELRQTPPSSSRTVAAANWFTNSGIQTGEGAVARTYRTDVRQYSPVSTELTGYTAGILTYLHDLLGDEGLLQAALRAGRFLTRSAYKPELSAMPFEIGSQGETLSYFFDLGIVARGLLSLWRATQDEEFLKTAEAVARAMRRDFLNGDGYHPVLSLPDKTPVPGDARWSRNPGCYQLKAALAWLETGEAIGDDTLINLYLELSERFAAPQDEFLFAEPSDNRVMDRLHAYSYFLEGLLPRASDRRFADLLRYGLRLASAALDAIAPGFERADARAQLLRLRVFAAALGVTPLDANLARKESARIAGFQYRSRDPRLNGGFCFGKQNSRRLPFANPATTLFAVQALELWRQYRRGAFTPDFRILV